MLNKINASIFFLIVISSLASSGCIIVDHHDPQEGVWGVCFTSACYDCDNWGCTLTSHEVGTPDTTCPPTMRYDFFEERCYPDQYCNYSSECVAGFVCLSNACIPVGSLSSSALNASCTQSSSCASGLCLNGICAAINSGTVNSPTHDQCLFDGHCGIGRTCVDGLCVNQCATSVDCAATQLCKNQICVDDVANSCSSDMGCAANEKCVNNRCLSMCLSNGTCASSAESCSLSLSANATVYQLCQPNYAARPACLGNADCGNGKSCVDGICRTACAKDADCLACGVGLICANGGFCLTTKEATPECLTNDDCAKNTVNKTCRNGSCIS